MTINIKRRSVYVLLFGVLSMLVLGCDKWPPNEDDVHSRFAKTRADLEKLEEILASSGYQTMEPSLTGTVRLESYENDEYRTESIDNKTEWTKLFKSAQVMDISRFEGGFNFLISDTGWKDAYARYGYIHYPNLDADLKVCRPEYREAPCGECIVKLDDAWWLHYRWIPSNPNDEDFEALSNGLISDDEYDLRLQATMEKCWSDGNHHIGYISEDDLE